MKIFATLDIDNDGDVTEEEFVQGCLKDEQLVIILFMSANDQDVRSWYCHHLPSLGPGWQIVLKG